jgi:hypothetical protein
LIKIDKKRPALNGGAEVEKAVRLKTVGWGDKKVPA